MAGRNIVQLFKLGPACKVHLIPFPGAPDCRKIGQVPVFLKDPVVERALLSTRAYLTACCPVPAKLQTRSRILPPPPWCRNSEDMAPFWTKRCPSGSAELGEDGRLCGQPEKKGKYVQMLQTWLKYKDYEIFKEMSTTQKNSLHQIGQFINTDKSDNEISLPLLKVIASHL